MIRTLFPTSAVTAAADAGGTRTIAGLAVPWGVPGRVSSGDTVVFEAGSLDPAARPVALRDHDRTRPIGRVVDAADTPAGMSATVRVSSHAAGDEALLLAGDDVLGMFSVGAEPTAYHYDDAGVLHVTAADWHELSLLTIGAYADARVSSVLAAYPAPDPTANPGGPMTATATDTPDPDVEVDPDADPNDDIEPDEDPDVTGEITTGATAVPVAAARGPRRPSRSPYAGVGIRQLAGMLQAGRTDARVMRQAHTILAAQGPASIEAALVDVTMADGAGYNRPGYQAELVELISWGTPTIDAIRQGDLQRGDYPSVTFNVWETTPIVGLQAGEKTEIASGPVAIGPASALVQTWAGGNDISQQTLDLGSPSFVEDYIRAAGIDYAKKADTYAVTTLLAAAVPVTTVVGDSFIAVVGKLLGALSPAVTPPGGLFLAMSYDVGVGLIGVPADQGPAFWDGSVSFGAFTPTVNVGGLSAFVDPNLPARTYLLGMRQGATWYDLPGTPFNLRAINVGLLGLDIAVYGYGACGVQYPGAFAKTTVPIA